MDLNGVRIISLFLICVVELCIWPLLCLVVAGVVQLINKKIRKKKPTGRGIKLAAYATIGFITLVLLEIVYFTMYWFLQFSVWLLLCLIVTLITAAVQLINKKIRKKKPIHWAIKLVGYVAFYATTLFVVCKILEPYPSNWFATNKEYRELVYELYNQELYCHEYREVYKGFYGEFVISFTESLGGTMEQRDYITLKNAVEEYMEVNESFQEKRISLNFRLSSGESLCNIFNFNPEMGEMGTDVPCWFVKGIYANNCTELAEIYHDFSGISARVGTLDDMQELANIRNLTYLKLYVNGMDKEDQDLEVQYLEELNTLLPDCEIHLN